MASPTSVEYFLRRLDSLAVSAPKTKRAKRITPTEPEPSFPVVVANLQDLPDDLTAHALAFLGPDIIDPMHNYCSVVVVAQVSKHFLSLALSNQLWRRICVARWKTKVGFAARLAQAETEAEAEAMNNATNTLIRGSYWYRKFRAEEDDALRSTITHDELHNSTFSMKLWFQSQLYPDMKRIKGAIASGLDWRSLSDTARFDLRSGTMLGMSKRTNGTPFFINDDGSIVNIRKPFETGTHSQFSLYVHRRKDWGWELRSQIYVLRSTEDRSAIDGLWTDYTSSLIIEKRKKGVLCTRRGSGIKYKRREVPDIEEIKEFLEW
jgi:hypothetical protein